MPSPPGAVVDGCMTLLTAQRVVNDVLPVVHENAGRNRKREEKAGTSTPCRTPLGMLTNLQTGQSSNKAPVKRKAKVLDTGTASKEA